MVNHYRRIYDQLRRQILDESFTEGDLLPSENELCAQYGVTRPTIRHALAELVNDGLIYKHKGKGSIVHRRTNAVGILSITGITSALGSRNVQTEIIHKPHIGEWPQPFPFELSREELLSRCIRMERLRRVTERAVFYEQTYLPEIHFPRFSSRNMENRSLFEVLRKRYHMEIKGGEQYIRSVPANRQLSDYFEIAEGHAVLYLERKFIFNIPEIFVYSLLYCNTDEFALYGSF
ncbi:MAG: GntR family transcriptional regulator [Bacteroidales bacterium]|jgi:GntR family transcriptional regulator/GntR family frlABCD operon transcriptional regulator|nr:GntR family transcriptional regulator [Bacteroidales bacterium]